MLTDTEDRPHGPDPLFLSDGRLQGQYDSLDDYALLDKRMAASEERFKRGDRVFYLSIPPNIFTTVAASASTAASSK